MLEPEKTGSLAVNFQRKPSDPKNSQKSTRHGARELDAHANSVPCKSRHPSKSLNLEPPASGPGPECREFVRAALSTATLTT